jgi:argininosuccinate lyase
VASRDFALEVLGALSLMMVNVSRLCEELILWSSGFIRFVSLDDAFCSTSSIMPQKKNPDTAEIMRAKSASVIGAHMAALATVKGLPMSYNRDLQELTPSVWRGIRDAKHSSRILVDMLSTATFDTGRMQEEAGKGYATATDLADMLVRRYDLPFRTAHTIVGRAVAKGALDLRTLDSAAQEVAGISFSQIGLTEEQIREALDVGSSIAQKRATGSPSPLCIRIDLEDRKKQLEQDRNRLMETISMLSLSRERLIADARRLTA